MRILQIIDSLEAGGAERMAVNYANSLAHSIDFSGLVVTRKEGFLRNQVDNNVSYLFLNKKRTFDWKALSQLKKFAVANKVEIIHAHSSSFFLAFLLKLSCPSLQLIWQDHYGNSEFLSKRPSTVLRLVLPFFSGVISVNQNLKKWAEEKMNCKNVIYLPNFPSNTTNLLESTVLRGIQGKRILCLANLRVQKNHFLLMDVAKKLHKTHPEWSFHLVGKDFNDDYSKEIRNQIWINNLENNVFLYGSKPDTEYILQQTTIAVLSSKSEGLPVALLEYGRHKKPIVATNVGEIATLINDGSNGFLVQSGQIESFYTALVQLIEDENLQNNFGKSLQQTIFENYSEKTILSKYLLWITNLKK